MSSPKTFGGDEKVIITFVAKQQPLLLKAKVHKISIAKCNSKRLSSISAPKTYLRLSKIFFNF